MSADPGPSTSVADDSGRPRGGKSRWRFKKIPWRPRKIPAYLAMAVIGLALLVGGLLMYSYAAPGELAAPPFTIIQLQSKFPIAGILYDVSEPTASITDISIYVQLPTNQLHAPVKAPAAELWLEMPPGIDFQSCSRDSCRFDPNDEEYVWTQRLDFKYEDFDTKSGEAVAKFFVKAHSLGYANNEINSSAAMPRVVFSGPGSAETTLYTRYNVTSADNYDWSTFRPQLASTREVLWSEPVTNAAEGTVVTGTDQANVSKQNRETLFAGALIGLAGGALVAAVQEWLHRNDDKATAKAMVDALPSHLGVGGESADS